MQCARLCTKYFTWIISFCPRAILWEGAIIIPIVQMGNTTQNQESTQEASPRAHVLNHFPGSFWSKRRLCGPEQLYYITSSPESLTMGPHHQPVQGCAFVLFSQTSHTWPIPQFSILISQSSYLSTFHSRLHIFFPVSTHHPLPHHPQTLNTQADLTPTTMPLYKLLPSLEGCLLPLIGDNPHSISKHHILTQPFHIGHCPPLKLSPQWSHRLGPRILRDC